MKKTIQPLQLLITCEDNSEDAAIRIYDDGKVVYYSSTRIGGVVRVNGGYLVKDVDEFVNGNYELKLLDSKEILKGMVEKKEDQNSFNNNLKRN